MSAIDRLAGRRILEEVVSPINGTITVVKEFLWGTYIMAGGLPQSGGLAERIWRKPLKKVSMLNDQVSNILILGFGGGGMVPILRKHWPEAKITGVDIDPLMVEMGRKYLDWEDKNVEIIIEDADRIVNGLTKNGSIKLKNINEKWQMLNAKFDLVVVDMYVGQGVPGKFNTTSFAEKVKKLLSKDGIAIFNRLLGGGKKEAAKQFEDKLKKVFPTIDTVRPEANIMFLCRS